MCVRKDQSQTRYMTNYGSRSKMGEKEKKLNKNETKRI